MPEGFKIFILNNYILIFYSIGGSITAGKTAFGWQVGIVVGVGIIIYTHCSKIAGAGACAICIFRNIILTIAGRQKSRESKQRTCCCKRFNIQFTNGVDLIISSYFIAAILALIGIHGIRFSYIVI